MTKIFTIKLSLLAALIGIGMQNTYAQCTFTGLNANYCTNSASTALTPGIPGGTFSGPGVVGSAFSPSLAGPGTFTVNYNICQSSYSITSGVYAPIASATAGVSETLGDDQLSGSIAIGFNFQFFCNTYTNYYISSNGYVSFNPNAGSGCCNGAFLPSGTTPDNLIACAWVDLYPPSGGTITHTTIGTSPSRTCVIAFNGINHYNGSSLNTCCPVTTQILLFETSNIIEIHSTSIPLANTTSFTYSTTMGIQNSGGTVGYAVTGRNASPTWTASNECYRWTPGATCAVSHTTTVSPSTISVAGNNSICIGSTASLTASGNTTYTWSTSSNSNSIAVSPSSTTTYSVSGTNSYGCIASSPITVTVDLTPTVTAVNSNGTGGTCPGRTLALSGSGATSYTWTGGTPTVTNGVAFSPTTSGTYTVTGANACGTSTAAISVSIHPLPSVTAVASSPSLCSGSNLTLTGVGNASVYAWAGGITNGVGFQPGLTNTYTVTGTSALTCTASATVAVTVVTTPVAYPTAQPALICIGKTSTLTATGATNYTWTTGTQTLNTAAITVTPAVGVTTYTVVKANSNCVDTKTISVTVNALPTIFAIVTPTLVCALSPATLAVGGAQTYTWTAPSTSGTYSFTGASPVVNPPSSSVYTVAASDGTCINTTTVYLATNPNPTLTIVPTSSMICNTQSVGLTVSGGINYTWTSSSNTNTLSGATITDTPAGPTAYNVTGNNSFGCTSSANQVIIVNPNPTITATANKTLVCSAGPTTLSAIGANTFTWDPSANGALTYSTIVNPTSLVSGVVIYTVSGTYTNTGCMSSKTVQVHVFIPTLTVSGPSNTCYGGNVTLVASGGNTGSYNWNTGSGFNHNFPSVSLTPTIAGVYTVTAITTSISVNCPATQTAYVGIYFNPTITATPQRTNTICRGESVNLYGHGGVSYAWSNAQTGGTITVSPTSQTSYTVTGTDANGCVSTGTILLKVSGCSGIAQLAAPNTGISIYPNPNNGDFVVEVNADMTLTLSNELGQTIRPLSLSGANNYKVSVSDLAKGIYFITGQKDNVQINEKIIVAK